MRYDGNSGPRVALLTGGHDATYAHGLTRALAACNRRVDVIGSDQIDAPFLHDSHLIRFFNLRGDQREDAPLAVKAARLARYYWRLCKYSVQSDAHIFHILWNNKIEFIDRTLLMLLYRLCGRRIVLTAHNVNAARRDGRDSAINRMTLKFQYRCSDRIFVHTNRMRQELENDFGLPSQKISVIPFGINDEVFRSDLSRSEARRRLGVTDHERVALIFGQIAPYKGLEHAVQALPDICRRVADFRMIIAGKVKRGHEDYWREIEAALAQCGQDGRVTRRIEHIPDRDVELYFKAADVLAMPYVRIFQSGLPFLAYSFGLPVVSTDAGSLIEDVIEGVTGFVCRPADPQDFARAVTAYFESELYSSLPQVRLRIRELALDRYSWQRVAEITTTAYDDISRTSVR